ncbi:MAG: GNAT family N-acetyltransferase [Ruminococcus sp.]|nr:GNAT family N-acetyltransferase [Ruminococcus sp.]
MIKVIDKSNNINLAEILSDFDANPFVCRIISLYMSYKPEYPFVDYWVVYNNDNKICGAIARNGSAFIVFADDLSCIDEVSQFMRVAGAESIICDGDISLKLYDFTEKTGFIMKMDKQSKVLPENFEIIKPELKETFKLIMKCSDDGFKAPVFEDFYVDVNHRIRHNTMRMVGIRTDNQLVSVGMTVAESKNSAVIGAVASNPNYRKLGYGSKIVSCLADELMKEGKTVYLHRDLKRNAHFYESLGFSDIGSWKEYYYKG